LGVGRGGIDVEMVMVDGATGSLLIGGAKLFPIVLSNGPPPTGTAPSGRNALAEVAAGGVNMIRSGSGSWAVEFADGQIATERTLLDAAADHGLHCWTWLGKVPNLPATAGSENELLLVKIVNALKGHRALAAWKGIDEPALGGDAVAGLVRAYKRLRALEPDHPLVIIEAPLGTVAKLAPYSAALDITGADIYPVSYPPGAHAGTANSDISVVGDVTRRMVQAARGKPVWTTLQIAWSGVLPPRVPRFPSLLEERFMAYQAIVAGARGLAFFGGHLAQPMRPADAQRGWNWTFWERVLKPLVEELTSTAVAPALVAPAAKLTVTASASDIDLATRQADGLLYLIAVRRGGSTSQIRFSGLPAGIGGGEVLFEYANGRFREVEVSGSTFRDWFGPHDAHVYRFPHSG
jgi:hypothetical protein